MGASDGRERLREDLGLAPERKKEKRSALDALRVNGERGNALSVALSEVRLVLDDLVVGVHGAVVGASELVVLGDVLLVVVDLVLVRGGGLEIGGGLDGLELGELYLPVEQEGWHCQCEGRGARSILRTHSRLCR